jgi:hypothetical protein
MKKSILFRKLFVLAILLAVGFGPTVFTQAQAQQYPNPEWAPAYYSGVRYYYMPDIEVYYDLSNRDFVYLENGQWMFSNYLPPAYNGYDLYTGYVISLNFNVFEPWMHHHYYVAHYPRYYYHNVYKRDEIAGIRGFNENERKPIYWKPEERGRVEESRRHDHDRDERKPEPTRAPQQPHYYGREIGKPVPVHAQMRENKQGRQENKPAHNENKPGEKPHGRQ